MEPTNNVIEHFIAHAKQGLCRRLGRAHLGCDLEDQPAQAALASDRHPDCVYVVCGTLEKLSQAFAELDQLGVTDSNPLQHNSPDTALSCQTRAWAQDWRERQFWSALFNLFDEALCLLEAFL